MLTAIAATKKLKLRKQSQLETARTNQQLKAAQPENLINLKASSTWETCWAWKPCSAWKSDSNLRIQLTWNRLTEEPAQPGETTSLNQLNRPGSAWKTYFNRKLSLRNQCGNNQSTWRTNSTGTQLNRETTNRKPAQPENRRKPEPANWKPIQPEPSNLRKPLLLQVLRKVKDLVFTLPSLEIVNVSRTVQDYSSRN